MKTPICPTCGCALIRLGITKDKAPTYTYDGKEYRFCCQGCVDLFSTDPPKHLQETGGLVVCPTCLTEKSLNLTVKLEHEGEVLYFCRCPHCMNEFKKNPEYYLRRLSGGEDYPGIFKTACCPI